MSSTQSFATNHREVLHRVRKINEVVAANLEAMERSAAAARKEAEERAYRRAFMQQFRL